MHEPVRDPAMGSWPLSPPQLAPSLYEMLVDRDEETEEELERPESQGAPRFLSEIRIQANRAQATATTSR